MGTVELTGLEMMAMGTVELTGLEMMANMALGQTLAAAVQMSATMLALVLNRSSLVMPGLRGTPAGITTISAPTRLASICSLPLNPVVSEAVSQWERSAATPGVCTMSYRLSLVTAGFNFSSRERGCPIPPLAPMTATVVGDIAGGELPGKGGHGGLEPGEHCDPDLRGEMS